MKSKGSPRLATILLVRFAPNDPLAGDLEEEYRAGRSRGWFWRQALTAVALASVRSVREHKLLAIKALVSGIVLYYVIGLATVEIANDANQVLQPLVPTWFLDYRLYDTWGLTIFWCAYALIGWYIAIFNRGYEAPALVLFLTFLVFANPPRFVLQAFFDMGPSDFAVYLLRLLMQLAVMVSATVTGGLSVMRHAQHPRRLADGR